MMRQNTKFSLSDIAVILLALMLCLTLLHSYYKEIRRETGNRNGSALGAIVFKRLSATRRSGNSLAWERMRNNSPVYARDTLRTADFSEAAVVFDDGTNLEMRENSMLQLDFADEVRTFQFLGGDITLAGGNRGEGTYSVIAGDETFTFSDTSGAAFSRNGEILSVEVLSGSLNARTGDGAGMELNRSRQLEMDLNTGDSRIISRTVYPLLPEPNGRYLIQRDGEALMDFTWEGDFQPREEGESLPFILEISPHKNFQNFSAHTVTGAFHEKLSLKPGIWYWRVRCPDGSASAERRFALYSEPMPVPIAPSEGEEFSFRKKGPAIRFSWSPMEQAGSYILEVSGDRGFSDPELRIRCEANSLAVDSLGEGTWYWRISPVHPFQPLEPPAEPEIRTLKIIRKDEMTPVDPIMPREGALYLIQEIRNDGLSFSWSSQGEAVEYEIALGSDPSLSPPMASFTTERTWADLTGEVTLAREGTYYWSVRWKDREGCLSPWSEPRKIIGVNGAIAARLSFPPDGYTIADSLIGSTRFTWKSNIPGRTIFQVAGTTGFEHPEFEAEVDTETLIGRAWEEGTWYWRLRIYNVDGSVFLDTPAMCFHVVAPLPVPEVIEPARDSRFILRKEDSYRFRWLPVDRADYYRFELIPRSGNRENAPILSDYLLSPELELPLGSYPDGPYSILIQAFARDKETSTRLIGYRGTYDFFFKTIDRMALTTPDREAVFEGLEAKRKGIRFEWSIPDPPEESSFIITEKARAGKTVVRQSAESGRAVIAGLPEGDYRWTVTGELFDFDISAPRWNSFTVRPIPLLPPPEELDPPSRTSYGPVELRERKALEFSWDPVEGATDYVLTLYRAGEEEPFLWTEALRGTSYLLSDLTVLGKGDFLWRIRAVALDGKGEVEQDGLPAEASFTISLPELRVPRILSGETSYGY